jgi:hypothetical protein
MLRKALTTAVLLAATLAGTDARAGPSVRLSVAIADERITLATDRRAWDHHRQWRPQGFTRRVSGHRRPHGFVAGRVGRGAVIVWPAFRFRYEYRTAPLITNRSFAPRPYRW